ncbi:hypothetical protein SteCoe_29555 [Stentor coeruleus]|uniref:Uncharacterized protein n=1 Tax=Stentor coeruleus TaxID=5963 RepID=A0A1R2B5X8_9CILI|nr:hypothetical protein SteCoe_29555 [Stentor coeruleus]
MASQAVTEVVISVGELPNPSGTQISFDLGSGINHVSSHKDKLRDRIGEDPADFKTYLTIPCASTDAAEKLASHLKATISEASTSSESFLGMLYSKLKPDPDEPALANFEVKTYAHNVFIVVSATAHEDQISMFYAMALDQAPDLMSTGNSLHVEVDTGRNAGEIISPNLGSMLTESALFKIVFTHDPQALVHARATAEGLGADRKILRALGYATLYSGASLKLNFKSGAGLPENVQAFLNGLSAMIPPLDQVLPPDVTTFAHGFIEHSGHELFVNVISSNVAVEVHLSLKGASQIFQFN